MSWLLALHVIVLCQTTKPYFATQQCILAVQECGQRSQGSNRDTHFYELDIQVKGSPALEMSLVSNSYAVPNADFDLY